MMGYSAGGGATWRWINQSPDRFAAAAPCGFTGGSAQDDAKKLAKLPIWAMAGGEDGKNPAGIRKMVKRLKAAGNVNVKHTEFEGADHRAGGRAVFGTVELVDWMLARMSHKFSTARPNPGTGADFTGFGTLQGVDPASPPNLHETPTSSRSSNARHEFCETCGLGFDKSKSN